MKILLNAILLLIGFAAGLTTMNYLHEDRIQIVEREVIKTIEKSVPLEVEKIVYKAKKCPKANKQKVCAQFISRIKELEDDAVDSEQEIAGLDSSLQEASKLKRPDFLSGKKNRVNLHVGFGRVGNKLVTDGSNISIQEQKDMIYGLQFERKLTNDWNGSISVHTDSKVMLGAGFEY